MQVKLTIKNFRAFSDENPAVIEIHDGFVALVGPNNTGKSSLLRLFYEFRSFWPQLASAIPAAATTRYAFTAQLHGVLDSSEIFTDRNDRPLVMEIELGGKRSADLIGKITFSLARSLQCTPRIFLSDGRPIELEHGGAWQTKGHLLSTSRGVFSAADLYSTLLLFQNALYIPPFRNAINQGAGDYFDLRIGSSFVELWDQWKTGSTKAHNSAIKQVTDDIQHIFELTGLEINRSNDGKSLLLFVNDKPYSLREVGSGLHQFIVTLGNVAIRRPKLILIDEPELNLHPSLQIDFLTSLANYGESTVLFGTHSLGLARSTASRIYSCRRSGDLSTIAPFETTEDLAEFLGEMSFSAFKDLGHDRVLFVEGVNDVVTVQQFLRHLRKDHTTVVVPLGGNQLISANRAREIAELRRLSDNVSVLIDSERNAVGASLSPEREGFRAECERQGIRILVTERRALEHYLTDGAVKQAFGAKASALAAYEDRRAHTNSWSKAESWRAARVMSIDDLDRTDLGAFLRAI